MSARISLRLDDEVRAILAAAARDRGIGLSTYIRQIATDAAREARRQRIRAQTAVVAAYIRENPEAREFYDDWGTPRQAGL